MNTIGADVDELDALGRSFARESRGLGATVAVIDATVRSSWWQGPSATRFEADWHRAHAATMRTVADLLEHAATCRHRRDSSAPPVTRQGASWHPSAPASPPR